MRKYALLNNNIVVKISDLEDAEYANESSSYDSSVDIEDIIPQPEIGWILEGNKLISGQSNLTDDQRDSIQQKSQRLFGLKLLPEATDRVGARNLKLSRDGTPADVAALAGQMASIKLLLEGGALKTVRSLCNYIKPSFPLHADILDFVIAEITNFLVSNGWN